MIINTTHHPKLFIIFVHPDIVATLRVILLNAQFFIKNIDL